MYRIFPVTQPCFKSKEINTMWKYVFKYRIPKVQRQVSLEVILKGKNNIIALIWNLFTRLYGCVYYNK